MSCYSRSLRFASTRIGSGSSLLSLLFDRLAFLSVYSVLIAGCYDRNDERMYPYRFEQGWTFGVMAGVADLDYDGSDEIVHRAATVIEMANEQWLFSESDGAVIDQVNVPGKVLRAPSFGDIDGERGDLEVLFAVNRNDSLYLYAYNRDGTSAGDPIFITSGKKRIDPDGTTYDWEAEARFFMIDVNNDHEKELVSIVGSMFAGLPRGVFDHDVTTGHRLGSLILNPVYIEDRIEHLRRKSRQILNVAGTVEETPTAVRVHEVLERIIESISGGIPGDIDIVEQLGEDMPPIILAGDRSDSAGGL